ncbi:glycosyltransferase family 2 protein [Flavobacterium columnare]|uniref:Glycosyltransferase n=1 Tax=Flavobacterium columnare TaxID=996 RepID=A0AAI8CH89_9FLAO|nr:glycosyltransferase [Flavobacterium columnare]AMO21158.1 glycosyltransferase [Flavobacterium columnare]AUX19179.1 hypothetical protein AQ623_13460 [Flavobacterium columnare]QOG58256.1 glycosyltransferase [Flavobacterium columnare]QOG60979.1 glycosyltransferase [Flavobacterium columnare]QOG63699.1 glycosyltransferase [Flavobacterium columnare]
MDKKPLLTIAIATKNREFYCIEAIKSILKYNDENIEIAIADNSETTIVKEFVEKLNSKQVKYIYDNVAVSSIENFNRAIQLTTGEYIMLIGDDDSILPNAVEIARWASENDVDTVSSKNIHTYFWPQSNPNFPEGCLVSPKFKSGFKEVDCKNELVTLLKDGLVNYMFYHVPKSYHGIVRKEVMEQIKLKTGDYYGGLSPDIFSVVAISLLSKKHFITEIPFSIAGVCSSSTTSDQMKGKHCGKLEIMPHLKLRKGYVWSARIPRFYCVTNTWGDSGLNALVQMKADNYLKYFNVYPLIAQSILMNRKWILRLSLIESNKLRKLNNINFLYFWIRTGFSSLRLIIEKGIRVCNEKISAKNLLHNNVNTIQDAINIITEKNNK